MTAELRLVTDADLPAHRAEQIALRPALTFIREGVGLGVPAEVKGDCKRRPRKRKAHRSPPRRLCFGYFGFGVPSEVREACRPAPMRVPGLGVYAPRKRRSGPRPKFMEVVPLTREEREQLQADEADLLAQGALPRPGDFAECQTDDGPCPWVGCRSNLYLDVDDRTGSITLNFPDKEPWELTETCAIKVAEKFEEKGMSHEEIGKLLNVSEARICQILAELVPRYGEALKKVVSLD